MWMKFDLDIIDMGLDSFQNRFEAFALNVDFKLYQFCTKTVSFGLMTKNVRFRRLI